MRKLVIEKSAVKNNLAVIKERAAGAVIYGVLSGDGGGAGIAALAQLLRDEGIAHFAVSEVSEAQALREAGYSDGNALEVIVGVGLATICNFGNNLAQTPLNEQLGAYAWSGAQ